MKITRKIIALVLVAMMTLALAIPAFAASDGSITITNATVGKDYAVYKVLDATVSGTNVAYSIKSTSPWYDKISAATTVFELTQIDEVSGVKTYSVTLKTGVSDDTVLKTFLTKETTDKYYKVSIPSGATAAASTSTGGATSETVAFTGLDYGYYLVTSTLGAFVSVKTAKTVKLIDKNLKPSWDNDIPPEDDTDPDDDGNPGAGKVIVLADGTKVTENSVNFGDTVNFDIGVNATNFDGDKIITYYYITDTLDSGFTLNTSSITVKVDGTAVTPLKTNYDATNGTIAIVLDWAKLNTSNELVPKYTKSLNEIHVSYSAVVTNTATLGATPNKNIADFNYDVYDTPYDPDDPPKPTDGDPDDPQPLLPDPPHDPTDDDDTNDPGENDPKETDTYVYALGLKKTDGSNALPGATFKVKDTTLKLKKISAGLYEYDATAGTANLVLDCDNNGYLVIKGLKEGTYVLNEYAAPAGYNLKSDDITFALAKGSDVETLKGVALTKSATFQNKTGVELPSTGGIGTTLFITFGMIAMVGAGVFLITNKRISKENF